MRRLLKVEIVDIAEALLQDGGVLHGVHMVIHWMLFLVVGLSNNGVVRTGELLTEVVVTAVRRQFFP